MAIMMALGSFQFSMKTAEYQQLKTSTSWRWASLDRVGRKPAKQFQGQGTDSKTFSISIYPQSANDLNIIDNIKSIGNTGQPQRLIAGAIRQVDGEITGTGLDLGLWTLDKLDVDEQYFTENGMPLEIKASLTISEYGEDSQS